MATFTSQSFNGRYITLTVTESDLDPINNRSKVNWSVSVSGANGVWYSSTVYLAINGTELVNTPWIDPPQGSFPMVNGTSSSGSLWVTHGSDGTKTVSVTFNTAIYYRAAEAHGGTFGLSTLDRAAPTVTATLGTIGVNSIAISASSGTVNCNSWDYRLGSGSWTNFSTTNGTSASKTITGLSTNTQYSITVRAKKTTNDVYGQSNTLTATTLGYANISSASNITLGSACNIKWSPYDSGHKFRITFKVGNTTVLVPSSSSYLTSSSTGVSVSGGVWTYTGTSPSIATFAPAITESSTASMTIILETFTSGGVSIGTSEQTVTVTVPNNSTTKPTVSITLAQGSTASGFTDTTGAVLCVKSLSNLKVTYNASGKYSAKIKNINVTIDGQQYAATANATSVNTYLETGILGNAGTRTVSATVTDSRGFTSTTATANIFVADYFNPSGSVTATISGQSVDTVATWSIAPVKDSQNKPVNTGSVAITRKKVSSGATTSYTVKSISASTSSSTTAESNYSGSGTWSASAQAITDANLETYEYTLKITDRRGNNYAVSYVASTGVTAISRLGGGKGVTFFGEAQNEGLWVVHNGSYEQLDPHEAYLLWGGKNFAGDAGVLDAAMFPVLGANRFELAHAAGIYIEYSRNSGSTWTQWSATDAQKVGLFTSIPSLSSFRIGNATSSSPATAQDQLRVTLSTDNDKGSIYAEIKKFAINVSTSGSNNCWVKIERATKAAESTWVTVVNKAGLYGWSGWNIINVPAFTTYGNATSQNSKIRFTFGCDSVASSITTYYGLSILNICAFGNKAWVYPSNLAKNGHLYSYDANQNAAFPAGVQGTSMAVSTITTGTNTAGQLVSPKVFHDAVLNLVYPVGSIYMSVNSTSPTTLFGGTWEQLQNTFLLAAGSSYTAGATGGEATHTLSVAEMPSHAGHLNYTAGSSTSVGNAGGKWLAANAMSTYGSQSYGWQYGNNEYYPYNMSRGSGSAHNNMPPYLVVYMWKRTG